MLAARPSATDARAARAAAAGRVVETPLLSSGWLSAETGFRVALKAENLQRTGSFKARGAVAKIDRLDERKAQAGAVAPSAGNHGQAVAYAAQARGVPCRVFPPDGAAIAKAEAICATRATRLRAHS